MSFDEWMSLSKQIGLIIFFLTFVAVVGWAFWPGNKERFEQMGRTPLDDDRE